MSLKFSDGVEFDLQGELRIESRPDGLYVVGEGMMCAVNTREEGQRIIDERKSKIARRAQKS